jgi:hypothetical protein
MKGSYSETTNGCPLALFPFADGEASLTLFAPQKKRGKNRRKTYQIKVRFPAFQDPQFSFSFPVFFSEAIDGLNKRNIGPRNWERDLGKVLKVIRSLYWDPFNKCIVSKES